MNTKTVKEFKAMKNTEKDYKDLLDVRLANISYTCCNIEVSEPKGSEVLCEDCWEWCETK